MAKSNNGNGIGFFGGLALIFITLKLIGIINWSWRLVLLPIWGPIAIIGMIGLLWIIGKCILVLLE